MRSEYRQSRRKFVQAALTAAAASSCGIACNANGTPWRFFTIEEARTLAALCDQIIPPDEDPGAAWAGVVNYADRQLCGPLQPLRDSYRRGIAAVVESSRLLHGAKYEDLTPEEQIGLLTMMEQGRAPASAWTEIPSTKFFELLLQQTMQGFYGDPRHGGNREGTSWKMLGIPYPPIRGRQRYDISKK